MKRKTYELTSIQDKNNPRARKREENIVRFSADLSPSICVCMCVFICLCLHGIKPQREDEGGRIMFSVSIKKADECKPMHSVH